MMLLIIGIIIGSIIGYQINNLIEKLDDGCHFKILGYNIYIGRNTKSSNVVKMEKKEKASVTIEVDNEKCKTCNNEDMFIKGTKHLIPCPKCKRNANKFKAPAK